MHLKIEIGFNNAAFEGGNLTAEVARILTEYAAKMHETEFMDYSLFDINGNRVGKARLAPGDAD